MLSITTKISFLNSMYQNLKYNPQGNKKRLFIIKKIFFRRKILKILHSSLMDTTTSMALMLEAEIKTTHT